MEHTLKAIDLALNSLVASTIGMGERVQEMVAEAGKALLARDVELARRVVEQDHTVDQEFEAIRAACIQALTRYHLVATDLRQVIAIEHSAGDLERAADHAKSIAKRVISGYDAEMSEQATVLFSRLHTAVLGALEDANDALMRGDADLARRVVRGDRQIDVFHDDLFHLVIAGMKRPGTRTPSDINLLFAAKSLERIGDHATNIAEEAMFMKKGEAPSATRVDFGAPDPSLGSAPPTGEGRT